MNQTQSSTISRSKSSDDSSHLYSCSDVHSNRAGSDFIHQSGDLSVPVSSRMEKRNHQLSDLSFDRSCRAPGILRFHWWSGEIGRAYRWIYHRIYRNGSHCRTVHRQLPQTMDPAYRYDRRNHRMLPFRNRMVLYSCRLHLPGSSRSLCNPIHPCRPGKNDYCNDHRTDDKEKNTVIAADGKVSHKYRL